MCLRMRRVRWKASPRGESLRVRRAAGPHEADTFPWRRLDVQVIRVTIKAWRDLRDVELHVGVCLVGENGTGKSGVLELLSAAAHQLGIAQGVEMTPWRRRRRSRESSEYPDNSSTKHRAPDAGTGYFVRESRVHLLGFYCGG